MNTRELYSCKLSKRDDSNKLMTEKNNKLYQ